MIGYYLWKQEGASFICSETLHLETERRHCKRVFLYLFGVRRHQVQTAGGDVEIDTHPSKLQVTLAQNTGEKFRGRLEERVTHSDYPSIAS